MKRFLAIIARLLRVLYGVRVSGLRGFRGDDHWGDALHLYTLGWDPECYYG